MKLIAQNYNSPMATQGSFENVIIEDVQLTQKRGEKYLSITFEMYYMKDGRKMVLATKELAFQGMEGDAISTNRTTKMSIPNPDYDAQIEGSKERLVVPMFDYLANHQGVMPTDYQIVDFEYPTFEKVLQYFNGGTLQSPEITITAPLAIGFLMNTLSMNGEIVGKQFTMV